jgi:hypothetical protein
MSSTVSVACTNPVGLVMELGLELNYMEGRFYRTPAYKRVRLNGGYRRLLLALPKGVDIKATRDLEPGLTDVDEEFAREWFRQHPRYAALGIAWIVEKPADLKHQVDDAQLGGAFLPLDPKGDNRVPKGAQLVETADFHGSNR